ncbi:hypothetical protein [Paenibacillus ginsengarvi]|nr:hypothetical protein [Paenibacillus ginsengarvi]
MTRGTAKISLDIRIILTQMGLKPPYPEVDAAAKPGTVKLSRRRYSS